jgi:hypothetical protein
MAIGMRMTAPQARYQRGGFLLLEAGQIRLDWMRARLFRECAIAGAVAGAIANILAVDRINDQFVKPIKKPANRFQLRANPIKGGDWRRLG